jgi:predicted alpha/beta superfamily hydrolase
MFLSVDVHHLDSAHLRARRRLTVLRPRVRHAAGPLPVLYLNDGQNLFEPETAIFGPHEWEADETVQALVGAFRARTRGDAPR